VKEETGTKCEGLDCPLRTTCKRYKPILLKRKVVHYSKPPYKPDQKKCNFYIYEKPIELSGEQD
jgi:hypothetical protein